MHKPRRLPYVLASMTFLGAMSWLSIRSYDSLIGRIYTGPIKDVFVSALHWKEQDRPRDFRTKAAIFYSDTTAGSLKDTDAYDALVNGWSKHLENERIANHVITTKDLLNGALRSYNVLILPLATYLSDDEIAAVKQFLSHEGHGLIFSGAAGAHRENGDWRDISLAAEIVGGENIREIAPDDARVAYMVLDGRNPLSANIPPGLRMVVNTYDRPLSATILEPRAATAGYWEGDDPARHELGNAGAGIANGTYRGGRFVWLGFTLGSSVDPFGLKVGDILLHNMLAYAGFKPLFAKEPWPEAKQAAVVFAQEMDDDLSTSSATLAFFMQKHVPCTVFCTPASAQAHASSFRGLAASPLLEIGLRGTAAYRHQPLENQKIMLLDDKLQLETLGKRQVQGFSPFEGDYDKTTVTALIDANYSYLAGDALSWAPPSVLQARKPPFIRRGRDLKLFIKFPHASAQTAVPTLDQLKREFDAVYRVGGFYNFSFQAQLLHEAGTRATLSEFIDYLKTKNVWFADMGEVADWSSRWMLVDVDSVNTSKTRANLIVTNNSPGIFASLRLRMDIPDNNNGVSATPEKLGGRINVVTQDNGQAVLEVRNIGADSLVFYIERHP